MPSNDQPDQVADELREYAATLILDAARNVEYSTIREMAEEHVGRSLRPDERATVNDLIEHATITIDFGQVTR